MPPKIGKVNMDGTMPVVLVENKDVPQAIAIDLDTKRIYYSTQYPSVVSTIVSANMWLSLITNSYVSRTIRKPIVVFYSR